MELLKTLGVGGFGRVELVRLLFNYSLTDINLVILWSANFVDEAFVLPVINLSKL